MGEVKGGGWGRARSGRERTRERVRARAKERERISERERERETHTQRERESVCVCVRARARVHACVRACLLARVRACVRARVWVGCSHLATVYNARTLRSGNLLSFHPLQVTIWPRAASAVPAYRHARSTSKQETLPSMTCSDVLVRGDVI